MSAPSKTKLRSTTTRALPSDNELVLTRFFAAQRELLWRAWTDPKHQARWWGPRAFTTPICEIDARPGGAYHVIMRGAAGVEYPVQGTYREFVPPGRLVVVMDASGHPPDWHAMVKPNREKSDTNPAGELITSVTLESRDGGTRLTIHVRFISAAVAGAMLKWEWLRGGRRAWIGWRSWRRTSTPALPSLPQPSNLVQHPCVDFASLIFLDPPKSCGNGRQILGQSIMQLRNRMPHFRLQRDAVIEDWTNVREGGNKVGAEGTMHRTRHERFHVCVRETASTGRRRREAPCAVRGEGINSER